MKLVDDKGKVLGRINIFDLMIVILVFLLLLQGTIHIARNWTLSEPEQVLVKIKGELCNVDSSLKTRDCGSSLPEYFYDNIYIGQAMRSKGEIIAKVDKIEAIGETEAKKIVLTLEVRAQLQDNELTFLGQELKINRRFVFATPTINFGVNVIYLDSNIIEQAAETITDATANRQTRIYDGWDSVIGELCTLDEADHAKECGIDIPDWFVNRIENLGTIEDKNAIIKVQEIRQMMVDQMTTVIILNLTTYDNEAKEKMFQGVPLKINNRLVVKSPQINFGVKILNIGTGLPEESRLHEKTIILKIENLEPEIFNSIQEGMTEKNNNNEVIAEIVGKTVQPHILLLTTEDGQLLTEEHPINKDITLETLIKASKSRDYYYNGQLVKIGNPLTVKTDIMDLNGEIIAIS